MRIETVVVFDHFELADLEKVRTALFVQWPDPRTTGNGKKVERNEDAQAHSLLHLLGHKNERWNRPRLDRAYAYLDTLWQTLIVQSVPGHWEALMADAGEAMPGEVIDVLRDGLQVPIIARPDLLVRTLAQARRDMADAVWTARHLVLQARHRSVELSLEEEEEVPA